MNYPCPCCGYLTLSKKPPGTCQICPICCWEDSLPEASWGSNQVTLRQAQLNFVEFGACEEAWTDTARRPTKDDARVSNWEPLASSEERVRQEVIDLITRAFDGVTREGGVSLHEAEVIDAHGVDEERRKARALDAESRWQNVPDADIEWYNWILPFLDEIGFRYYIPAYMVWTLRNYKSSESASSDFAIYVLAPYPKREFKAWRIKRFEFLDDAQSHAVYRFLRYVVDYGDHFDDDLARQGIQKYWGRFSDPNGERK